MISLFKAVRQREKDVSEELETRYGMDPVIWNASMRKKFPFNLSLLTVFSICMLGLFISILLPIDNTHILKDYNFIACISTTTLLSIFAFYLTDKGINEFKAKLESKGLFGRDLNKIGDHRDQSKEKM